MNNAKQRRLAERKDVVNLLNDRLEQAVIELVECDRDSELRHEDCLQTLHDFYMSKGERYASELSNSLKSKK